MSFELIKHNSVSYLVEKNLSLQGIRHGFADASLDMRLATREAMSEKFCHEFGTGKLNLLRQMHGNSYFFVAETNPQKRMSVSEPVESDAIIIENINRKRGEAFGVLSADCLPLILYSDCHLALIHSGWRGLANGILLKVSEKLMQMSNQANLLAVAGPAAGSASYEVGAEVIEQLGMHAVYKRSEGGKYLLSLSSTAEKILSSRWGNKLQFVASDICVITDKNYFSYRREGEEAGRNLTFVIL